MSSFPHYTSNLAFFLLTFRNAQTSFLLKKSPPITVWKNWILSKMFVHVPAPYSTDRQWYWAGQLAFWHLSFLIQVHRDINLTYWVIVTISWYIVLKALCKVEDNKQNGEFRKGRYQRWLKISGLDNKIDGIFWRRSMEKGVKGI